MAFVREYMAQGDPFSLRGVGRFFKRGARGLARGARGAVRGVGKVGGLAARLPFIGSLPGIGTALSLARAAGLSAGDFEDEDQLMDWARSYGYMAGDPATSKKTPKRKQAAAGPRAKAARKKEVRRDRAHRGPSRVGQGLSALSRAIGGAASHLPGLVGAAGSLLQSSGEEDLSALVPAGLPTGPAGAGAIPGRAKVARMTKRGTLTFRKKPSMQVTNTQALRRGLRRIEGFNHVVKRLYKALPALRPGHGSSHSPRGGHKAGCRCVACKNR